MPRAVAVAAQVVADRSPTAFGQVHRSALPGVTGLPAAMAEHDRPRCFAAAFDSEPDAGGEVKVDAFVHGAWADDGSP